MASTPTLTREGYGIAGEAFAKFAVKNGYGTETLADDVTLDDTYPSMLGLDPGGAHRDVTLEAEASSTGVFRLIVNKANAAENLVIKDDGGSTIVTANQDEAALVHCNGTAWSLVILFTAPLS